MKKIALPLFFLVFILTFQSCKDKKNDYTVPTSYNFSNANYSDETIRLNMMDALINGVKAGSTAGTILNAQALKNMYTNTAHPFTNDTLNSSGLQLKDRILATDQPIIETWIDNAATASQAGATGSNGTAGIVTSGTKTYLMDANGVDYKEGVEKHLQSSLIYHQITAVCLADDHVGSHVALADRQHNWDAAFGYFGIPVDYPTTTTGLLQLGKYCGDRNALLGNATAAMNAFLKGRAAINNGDEATVTAQIAIIRDKIEVGVAGTAVHYINSALASIGDNAVRNHGLSEGYFLVEALKYNPTKKVTDAQLQTLLGYFGTNFYTVNTTNLQAAKDLLSSIYGFDAVKDQL